MLQNNIGKIKSDIVRLRRKKDNEVKRKSKQVIRLFCERKYMKLKKFEGNPILSPNKENDWESFCVLNPAVVFDEIKNEFVMVYRAAGNDAKHLMSLGIATSKDGIHFTRASNKPVLEGDPKGEDTAGPEDPRIVKMGDAYFLTYAARGYYAGRYWLTFEDRFGPNSGCPYEKAPDVGPSFLTNRSTVSYLAYSRDLYNWKRLGRITDSRFDNRDVVIFPEKIKGKFYKIERPYCDGPNPSIWISSSNDLMEWETPSLLYKVGQEEWETERIGAGCPPLKTEKGWLLLYHGVNIKDHKYRIGFMLLDLNNPKKIIAKTKNYVMEPEESYESSEMYPGCVFPTGWVNKDGVLYIYYGCGDKYVSLATTTIPEILEELSLATNQYKGGNEK